MSYLPVVSGREVVKALGRIAYELDQQRGSHIVIRPELAPHRRLVVPDHRSLAKGIFREIIRQAGLTTSDFIALL